MTQCIKGFCLVILSAVIFGFDPLIAKTVYANGSNALNLTFHRLFFGMPCLFLIQCMTSKVSLIITKTELKKLLICSAGYALTPVFLLSSYNYVSSGMATTVHFVYPVLVLLGCAIFYREKVSTLKCICCVLCMGGILCFYTPGNTGSLKGITIAFISGIIYAFYIVYLSKSGLQTMPPYKRGFYLTFFGSVEVFVVTLLTGQLTFHLTLLGWELSVFFAILVSVIATIAFQVGTKYIGPQNASLLSTFEPLTSVIVGVLVFHENIVLRSIIGIICILLAVVLLTVCDI